MHGVPSSGAQRQEWDCAGIKRSANKNSGLTWDEPTLARYLRAPGQVVPGTKMIFAGLKKAQEISDVIAYLKQFAPDGKQVGG